MNISLKFILTILAFAVPIYAQAGAIVAVEEAAGSTAAEAGQASSGSKGTGSKEKSYSKPRSKTVSSSPKSTKPTTDARPSVAARTGKPYNGPILGDTYSFLNFEVVSADKPIYRRAAKQAGASGLVQVAILVDTDGAVLEAKARTGNKLLWAEAERAALASKLNRPILNGQPVRALGFLVYRFGAAEADDDDT
jgi:outer membrane biosynthesis protein TonB